MNRKEGADILMTREGKREGGYPAGLNLVAARPCEITNLPHSSAMKTQAD